jgi:hypothetical protein
VDLSFNPAATGKGNGAGTPVAVDPTAAAVPTPAYDLQAGNCPDAANQAIALMTFVQSKGYNLDMQLELAPRTVLCGQSGSALATYRARVATANLSAWAIDGSWSSFYMASRTMMLHTLLDRLHTLYPAAIARVTVYQADTVLGSGILGTDNNPRVTCCSG